MTGINVEKGRPPKTVTPSDRYPILKQAPERYSLLQWGICLFFEMEGGWEYQRYNFHVFPDDDRDIVLDTSSMKFLNNNGMSWDQWARKGISFLTTDEALKEVTRFCEEQQAKMNSPALPKSPSANETVTRNIQLTRTADVQFAARAMADLREWLDSSTETTIVLPECSSFLRRALYESIGKEYPHLELENAGPDLPNRIRVWRLTEKEREEREFTRRAEAWEKMQHKIGLWRVMEALRLVGLGYSYDQLRNTVLWSSKCKHIEDWIPYDPSDEWTPLGKKIPIVVHNGFMDICFLLTHFHVKKLPETLPECKQIIRHYFPSVYDTKFMVSECRGVGVNADERSVLAALYERRCLPAFRRTIHRMEEPEDGEVEEDNPTQEHEADYDAFMTGCVYISLCKSIQTVIRRGQSSCMAHLSDPREANAWFGRNRLYQYSIYSMDLEAEIDPLHKGMRPDCTYCVSDIDPSIKTRDVVHMLAAVLDSEQRTVNYDIIWLNDTSFLVATNFQALHDHNGHVLDNETVAGLLTEHGILIRARLSNNFSKIMTLEEQMDLQNTGSKKPGFLGGWWNALFGSKRGDGDRPRKRRRTE